MRKMIRCALTASVAMLVTTSTSQAQSATELVNQAERLSYEFSCTYSRMTAKLMRLPGQTCSTVWGIGDMVDQIPSALLRKYKHTDYEIYVLGESVLNNGIVAAYATAGLRKKNTRNFPSVRANGWQVQSNVTDTATQLRLEATAVRGALEEMFAECAPGRPCEMMLQPQDPTRR